MLKMGAFHFSASSSHAHSPAPLRTAWLFSLQTPFHPLNEKSSPLLHSHGCVEQSQTISAPGWLQGGGRMAANVTPGLGMAGSEGAGHQVQNPQSSSRLTSSWKMDLWSSCGTQTQHGAAAPLRTCVLPFHACCAFLGHKLAVRLL